MEEPEKSESQPLIKGCFHPKDASEILSTLYLDKMQYHSVAALSAREREGKGDEAHKKRIDELSHSLRCLSEMIQYAKQHNRMLDIECEVKMCLKP